MRKNSLLAFDDYIEGASHSSPVFTNVNLNDELGKYDQLAIQVVVDEIKGLKGTFEALLEHSSDGRNWVQKNPSHPPVGDVELKNLDAGTNIGWGSDPGPSPPGPSIPAPFLSFVRLRMYFTGPTSAGHVKVYVTMRDQGG